LDKYETDENISSMEEAIAQFTWCGGCMVYMFSLFVGKLPPLMWSLILVLASGAIAVSILYMDEIAATFALIGPAVGSVFAVLYRISDGIKTVRTVIGKDVLESLCKTDEEMKKIQDDVDVIESRLWF
jgi:hypothetical protein